MNNSEKLVDEFLDMIQPKQITMDQQIQTTKEDGKVFINLFVKKHPYHDDTVRIAEFNLKNEVIMFYEQHRVLFQNMIEKMYSGKNELDKLIQYKINIVSQNKCFASSEKSIDTLLNKMKSETSVDILKTYFLEIMSILDYDYRPPTKSDEETVKNLTDKLIKAIAVKYTESLVYNHQLIITFDIFKKFITDNEKTLIALLRKIRDNMAGYCYGKQITEKISSLINPKYLTSASLKLNLNSGNTHSVVISLENNPWRNGVIKGDLLFARIKAEGKEQYIYFKSELSNLFTNSKIYNAANNSTINSGCIELNSFVALLDNCDSELRNILQMIFLKGIMFPEFGCCSKWEECGQTGKCLHIDQLYATACQYQKLLKRTGKFE